MQQSDLATAIYARQSRASRTGYSSCEAQIRICRDLASERGFQVRDVFSDEGESSETLDRPGLQSLLAAIRSGTVNRVVVYSLDRLTRRIVHLHTLLEWFDEHRVELVVTTDPYFGSSAASRLMTNITAAASEFQQDLTRERMADMRAALKRPGKRVAGRVPFGYLADPVTKKLATHPEQRMIVRDFFELAALRRRNPYPNTLRGSVVCEQCNRPMSTSVSHRGPIRYLYYRCRSQAGGRPPCQGVNIGAFELEQFVCELLMDSDDQSEIFQQVRNHWTEMNEVEQRASLPKVIRRVVYHHQASEITIELKESYGELS